MDDNIEWNNVIFTRNIGNFHNCYSIINNVQLKQNFTKKIIIIVPTIFLYNILNKKSILIQVIDYSFYIGTKGSDYYIDKKFIKYPNKILKIQYGYGIRYNCILLLQLVIQQD